MTKIRKKLNQPQPKKVDVGNVTAWSKKLDPKKIPYVSHVPMSPIKMTHIRKKRIKRVLTLKNKGLSPAEIAEQLKIKVNTVKRDLTTAMVLTAENLPHLPPEDRSLMLDAAESYKSQIKDLTVRVKVVLEKLEATEAYLNPKQTAGFAMILSELRQSLELGAKITGELQTGTKVNVNIFSNLAKRIVEIVSEETDRTTFARIRDRIALELQGREPLGAQGGQVNIVEGEIVE